MATQMLQRRAPAATWAAANPILGAGEIGFEEDTKIMKLGDGVTPWLQLTSGYVSKRGGDVIQASGPGVTPVVVKGAPGQTGDLFRAETSDAVAMRVDNTGAIFSGGARMLSRAEADPLYLFKGAKAADSELLDGVDSTAYMHVGAVGGGRNTKQIANLNQGLMSGWYDGSGMTGAPNAEWFLVQVIAHSNGSSWQRQIAHAMTGETGNQAIYSRRCNGADPTLAGSWTAWQRVDVGAQAVTSVNGRTGAVTGLAEASHGVHGVSSVNGRTGGVSGLYESSGGRVTGEVQATGYVHAHVDAYPTRIGEIVGYAGMYTPNNPMMFYTEANRGWTFRSAGADRLTVRGDTGGIWSGGDGDFNYLYTRVGIRVGDDSRLEDINEANTMRLTGVQDGSFGRMKLGNGYAGVAGNVYSDLTLEGSNIYSSARHVFQQEMRVEQALLVTGRIALNSSRLFLRSDGDNSHFLQHGSTHGFGGDGPLLGGYNYFGVYNAALNAVVMRLDGSGNMFTRGSGNFNQSTRRFKTNIRDLEEHNGLDFLRQLRPIRYDRTDAPDLTDLTGLIAEDVGELAPELVMMDDQTNEVAGLNYAGLTTYLILALQQADAKISTFEARLAALENA